jgi:hypothetical protein
MSFKVRMGYWDNLPGITDLLDLPL